MSKQIDYSKGIYDARQLGAGRMFILGVQHMFAMFGATVLVPRMPYKMNAQSFKHGCLKAAALSCHTMWQPKRLTRHDAKPTERS